MAIIFVVSLRHNLYWRWKFGPHRYCFYLWLVTAEGFVLKGRCLRQYKKLLRLADKVKKCNQAIKHGHSANHFRLAQQRNESARHYNALMRYSGYIFNTHQFLPPAEEPMRRRFHYIDEIRPRHHV
ncbi:MAG: hypothetical protein HYV67_01265 [Candidatus Taylorbacteria bacterium]|nr:hypothetical protein [Candidatus Taylorbacteria bacterium]